MVINVLINADKCCYSNPKHWGTRTPRTQPRLNWKQSLGVPSAPVLAMVTQGAANPAGISGMDIKVPLDLLSLEKQHKERLPEQP